MHHFRKLRCPALYKGARMQTIAFATGFFYIDTFYILIYHCD